MILKRFFAKSGTFAAYEMFSKTHFFIVVACFCFILWALHLSRGATKEEITKIVRRCAYILWALEIIKIIFNFAAGNAKYPNSYIPLYFCSIPLYTAPVSGWGRGRIKRIGDVFLTVGGVVGGIAYILSPVTTAGTYPAFHFITIQSFVLHSVMIYLSLLFIKSGYYELKMRDLSYYVLTVVFVGILAYTINHFLGTNLMFVSQNNPGTAVEILYNINPKLFPLMIIFWQAVPPFIVVYGFVKLYKKRQEQKSVCENNK